MISKRISADQQLSLLMNKGSSRNTKKSGRAEGVARSRLRRPTPLRSVELRGARAGQRALRPAVASAKAGGRGTREHHTLGGATGEQEGNAPWKRPHQNIPVTTPSDSPLERGRNTDGTRKQSIIAHLDMDAFFAAIEERDNPQFAGMPIVVGADPRGGAGRGVVSTANYAARKFGIFSATPITRAWRFAQEAKARGEAETIFLSGHWRKYSATSQRIMSIIEQLVPHMQPISVDEAYLDLSFTQSFTAAEKLCQKIKQTIKQQEKITASIGVGPNKLIAKIASDAQKPDGLVVIPPEAVEAFLDPLPLRAIPGIGPKTEAWLKQKKLYKVSDLKPFSQEELEALLGKWGLSLYGKIRGRGSSTFHEPEPAKSISEQHTFPVDTNAPHLLIGQLMEIAPRLPKQFEEENFTSFRTVTVTVRFADFETHTYSHTLTPNPLHPPYQGEMLLRILQREALRLILPFLDHRKNPQGKLIRLIGLRIEKLS